MDFQLWIRQLLSDAVSRNKAHVVAEISPHVLKMLYEQGAPPLAEEVIAGIPSKQLRS